MALAFAIGFAPGMAVWAGVALAGLGVIILGISKSGFGGGVGIVAVPLFALAFGRRRGRRFCCR